MEADDGYEEDPDEVVTVGHVHPTVAPLVVSALAAEGIRAEMVEQRPAYRTLNGSRILCFARDRDRAAAIIDEMLAADADADADDEDEEKEEDEESAAPEAG